MKTITIYKLDHHNNPVWHYEGLEVARGASWICVQAVFGRADVDVGYVVFRRGDVMTEWFYSDRWYNIFRIEDVEDGRLKGWYCNITRPAHITADVIAAADLALDVFVTPTGNFYLLDEDEFEALDLSMDERMSVVNAVDSLRRLVGTRAAPFNEILRQTKPLA